MSEFKRVAESDHELDFADEFDDSDEDLSGDVQQFAKQRFRLLIIVSVGVSLSAILVTLLYVLSKVSFLAPGEKVGGGTKNTVVNDIPKLGLVLSPTPSASEILRDNLPHLIYGTAWKKNSTKALVETAVINGFRIIDTANQPKHYNEEGTGDGWTSAAEILGLKRNDFFLQTKFSPLRDQDSKNVPYNKSESLPDMIYQSAHGSLLNLQTDYLDALMLHSPYKKFDDTLTAWRAMESLVDDGIVLQIGISNCYKFETFSKLYEMARIKPQILQNHLKTINFDPQFLQFTRDHPGMQYQAFCTLTSNKHHLQKKEIRELASRKGLSTQLYMYGFLLSLGITPLDGSKTHQVEDLEFLRKLRGGEIKIFENEEEINEMAELLEMKLP